MLFAINITNIDQLDNTAVFSFVVISDNRGGGGGTNNTIKWINKAPHKFGIANGDLFNGNNDTFDQVMKNDPFIHNKTYPSVGDHDNQIVINGQKGTEQAWGRGHVIYGFLNDFHNRPNIEWRKPTTNKIQGKYDDQYIDYYAHEQHGGITVHMVVIHKGDESTLAPRSAEFMYKKVVVIPLIEMVMSRYTYSTTL